MRPSRSPGKERDSETGLDYFGARYYGSSLGRWMSPDWAANPTGVPYAEFGNPQSLNLYSYVGNNPLANYDPDGHACPGNDCNKITVTAEKSDSVVTSSKQGRVSNATLEAQVTYTFNYNGKPMADTQVHEDISNKSFRDGRQESVPPTTKDGATDKNGKIPDTTTIEISTSVPSLPGTNAAKQILTTGEFSKETTQILTVSSPNGDSCSVTQLRTLSIKDGVPNLTLQSPKTQRATPVPAMPPKELESK